GRIAGIDAVVLDCRLHKPSLVIPLGDDDIVEDGGQSGLADLVLLGLAVADAHRDDPEVVMRTSEHGCRVSEEFRFTEEGRTADVLANSAVGLVGPHPALLGEPAVGGDHRRGQSVPLEAMLLDIGQLDLANELEGLRAVKSTQSHEIPKPQLRLFEVRLADRDGAVDVHEESGNLSVGGAEVSPGNLTFPCHGSSVSLLFEKRLPGQSVVDQLSQQETARLESPTWHAACSRHTNNAPRTR